MIYQLHRHHHIKIRSKHHLSFLYLPFSSPIVCILCISVCILHMFTCILYIFSCILYVKLVLCVCILVFHIGLLVFLYDIYVLCVSTIRQPVAINHSIKAKVVNNQLKVANEQLKVTNIFMKGLTVFWLSMIATGLKPLIDYLIYLFMLLFVFRIFKMVFLCNIAFL